MGTAHIARAYDFLASGPKTKRQIQDELRVDNGVLTRMLREMEESARVEVFVAKKLGREREMYQLIEVPEREQEDELHTASDTPIVDSPLVSLAKGETIRTMYIPDLHAPFHDKLAFALLMKYGKKLHPHRIVILGDWVDNYSVSHFDRDTRRVGSLTEEIDEAKACLEEVADLGAERVIFCAGNHEDRLRSYLLRNAPPLIEYFNIPELLGIKQRGWTYVPYKRHIKVGKLYATHDIGYAGVHAAHSSLTAFGHSLVFGHTHQLSERYLGTVAGERFVAINAGWLGDIYRADYEHEAKKRFWQLGFAISYEDPQSHNFQAHTVPIVGYRCMLDGKVIALR